MAVRPAKAAAQALVVQAVEATPVQARLLAQQIVVAVEVLELAELVLALPVVPAL